jgi:hypothetical protein
MAAGLADGAGDILLPQISPSASSVPPSIRLRTAPFYGTLLELVQVTDIQSYN